MVTTFDTLKFAEAVDTQIATKGDTHRIEKEMLLLKWMIGFNLAFTMAVVWRVFS